MAGIVDNVTISSLLGKYYSRVKSVGYVDKNTTDRYMLYLFLVGFIDSVYVFFSDKDYRCIDALLSKVFSGCNCLLKYDKNTTMTSYYLGMTPKISDVTIGRPWYMGSELTLRVSEENEEVFRITENDMLRIPE